MRVNVIRNRSTGNGAGSVSGIDITNLPDVGKQKLTPRWLGQFKQFITQSEEDIIVHTIRGDVIFHIDHGLVNNAQTRYCLTCDEVLPDNRADPFGDQCREHVKGHGKSAETSERWPPGYMVVNAYECTIEDQRNA